MPPALFTSANAASNPSFMPRPSAEAGPSSARRLTEDDLVRENAILGEGREADSGKRDNGKWQQQVTAFAWTIPPLIPQIGIAGLSSQNVYGKLTVANSHIQSCVIQ